MTFPSIRERLQITNKQSKNRLHTLEIEVTKGAAAREAVEKMLRRREAEVKSSKADVEKLRAQIADRKEKEKEVAFYNQISYIFFILQSLTELVFNL